MVRRYTRPFAILLLAGCGQAQPRDAAQTARTEAAQTVRPQIEAVQTASSVSDPSDAGATQSASGAVSAGSCEAEAPSALAQAAFEGDLERARILIVGEELDASTRPGCAKTPLMMALSPYPEEPGTPPGEARARRRDKLDAAGLFLTRCFDVTGSDAHGLTALHLAVLAPEPERVVVRLMQRMFPCGAQPDMKTDEGITPLMLAVEAKRKAVVEALLEAGADVNAQSNAGKTPLQLAEETRDRALIALLRKATPRDAGHD